MPDGEVGLAGRHGRTLSSDLETAAPVRSSRRDRGFAIAYDAPTRSQLWSLTFARVA